MPTDLLGTWTLTRVILDRRTDERRDVVGAATLVAESAGRVRWSETGAMTWPGHEVEVRRTLYVDRDGDGWLVRFEDGRLFHPWSVGADVEHVCTPDRYRGRIDASSDAPHSWTVSWEAVGPQKDYRMETAYVART